MQGMQTPRELTAEAIRGLERRFRAVPGLLAVYLHGSAARGALRPGSDVDLACLFEGAPLAAVDIMDLAAEWGIGLLHPVDVGLLTTSNLVYAYQALMQGRCIYCRDEAARDARVATLLGIWAQFTREREEVRHAYAMAG